MSVPSNMDAERRIDEKRRSLERAKTAVSFDNGIMARDGQLDEATEAYMRTILKRDRYLGVKERTYIEGTLGQRA